MMNKPENSTQIPEGFYRVRSGAILPDDLCWSVMENVWLRHDDPAWHPTKAHRAENAYCVIRKISEAAREIKQRAAAAGDPILKYSIRREPEQPDDPEPEKQAELF